MVGYSADELTTKPFLDITHPDDLAASVERFELMRDSKIEALHAQGRLDGLD